MCKCFKLIEPFIHKLQIKLLTSSKNINRKKRNIRNLQFQQNNDKTFQFPNQILYIN